MCGDGFFHGRRALVLHRNTGTSVNLINLIVIVIVIIISVISVISVIVIIVIIIVTKVAAATTTTRGDPATTPSWRACSRRRR